MTRAVLIIRAGHRRPTGRYFSPAARTPAGPGARSHVGARARLQAAPPSKGVAVLRERRRIVVPGPDSSELPTSRGGSTFCETVTSAVTKTCRTTVIRRRQL